MVPARTLSLQQVTNQQNKSLEDLWSRERLGANPRVQNDCPVRCQDTGTRATSSGPGFQCGAVTRSSLGAASRGRPPRGAHLAATEGEAPRRGRGRRAGAETARGRDPAPPAAPPRDDAAPADSPPRCHSLLTMVAAQSNKPGRPLPP